MSPLLGTIDPKAFGKPEHTIAALCVRSDAISRDKGWITDKDARPYHTAFILQVSELSEALEDYRNNKKLDEVYYEVKYTEASDPPAKKKETMSSVDFREFIANEGPAFRVDDAKPCGIPIELADFVIRVCQRCGTDGYGESLGSAFTASLEDLLTNYENKALHDFERMLADVTVLTGRAYQFFDQISSRIYCLAQSLAIVFAFCENNGIDLWSAIDEKEAYNKTRPMRHGGKKI
jgi:hypothetical protein